MAVFDHMVRPSVKPDVRAMAETIHSGLCSDVALGQPNHDYLRAREDRNLRELDREVREFVSRHGSLALQLAVEHWFTAVASREAVMDAVVPFSHRESSDWLRGVLEKGDGPFGLGLMQLQKAMNDVGVVLGPTVHDQLLAAVRELTRAPDTEPEPRPEFAIADLLWPVTQAETALQHWLAHLGGVAPDQAAWELFALRENAFAVVTRSALRGRSADRDRLEAAVAARVQIRSSTAEPMADPDLWHTTREIRYFKSIPTQSTPGRRFKAEWLHLVRRTFGRCFENHVRRVELIGGKEYDTALLSIVRILVPSPGVDAAPDGEWAR